MTSGLEERGTEKVKATMSSGLADHTGRVYADMGCKDMGFRGT